MLFRRYGDSIQSVVTRFDSRAITEISFRRDQVESLSVEEFEVRYESV